MLQRTRRDRRSWHGPYSWFCAQSSTKHAKESAASAVSKRRKQSTSANPRRGHTKTVYYARVPIFLFQPSKALKPPVWIGPSCTTVLTQQSFRHTSSADRHKMDDFALQSLWRATKCLFILAVQWTKNGKERVEARIRHLGHKCLHVRRRGRRCNPASNRERPPGKQTVKSVL